MSETVFERNARFVLQNVDEISTTPTLSCQRANTSGFVANKVVARHGAKNAIRNPPVGGKDIGRSIHNHVTTNPWITGVKPRRNILSSDEADEAWRVAHCLAHVDRSSSPPGA